MKQIKTIAKRLFLVLLTFMSFQTMMAQGVFTAEGDEVPAQAEDYFKSLLPHVDSAFTMHTEYPDKFLHRLSFHFNLVDWATTIPSLGVELDLNKTPKNTRSISIFGKYNGMMNSLNKSLVAGQKFSPSFIYNQASIRVEYRKYWRTGGIGESYNNNYKKISLDYPKNYPLDTMFYMKQITYYQGKLRQIQDSLRAEEQGLYYVNKSRDSVPPSLELRELTPEERAVVKKYNGNPYKSKMYNMYHAFRRNVTSTRTLRNPRNWRAYYVGAYAGYDKYNICFNKKGIQGMGINIGASAGYSIPLIVEKYPREGGMDLDLGGLLGLKMVKYDAYRQTAESSCYIINPEKSKSSLSFVPFPVIQEVRVGLVYRFRTIGRKLSREIIDDYSTDYVEKFDRQKDDIREKYSLMLDSLKNELAAYAEGRSAYTDSITFWNDINKRRLEYAMRLNADTTFTGANDTLYNKLFLNLDMTKKADIKKLEDIKKAKAKLEAENQRIAAKEAALKEKEEKREAERLAAEEKKKEAEAKKNKKKGDSPDEAKAEGEETKAEGEGDEAKTEGTEGDEAKTEGEGDEVKAEGDENAEASDGETRTVKAEGEDEETKAEEATDDETKAETEEKTEENAEVTTEEEKTEETKAEENTDAKDKKSDKQAAADKKKAEAEAKKAAAEQKKKEAAEAKKAAADKKKAEAEAKKAAAEQKKKEAAEAKKAAADKKKADAEAKKAAKEDKSKTESEAESETKDEAENEVGSEAEDTNSNDAKEE